MEARLKALELKASSLSSQEAQSRFLLQSMNELVDHLDKEPVQHVLRHGLYDKRRTQELENQKYLKVSEGVLEIATRLGVADHLQTLMGAQQLGGSQAFESSWAGPLQNLPCANIAENKTFKCHNIGSKACSGCRLVSYCSQDCQKKHWPAHKTDCKHKLNSDAWKPSWTRRNRTPTFVEDLGETKEFFKGKHYVGRGITLWGNTPAIDLLNLNKNEGENYDKNLSLAFAASGDLRNVIKTINNIPKTFTGNVDVVINDINPMTTARNFLLLLILNGAGDRKVNVDIALHFWYSVSFPRDYHSRLPWLSNPSGQSIDAQAIDLMMTTGTRLRGDIGPEATRQWLRYIIPTVPGTPNKAQEAFKQTMNTAAREDYTERYYCKLKPSHRLSVQNYRNTGIVLPFGAAKSHFDTANPSLFDSEGIWWQSDNSSPLAGYDLGQVIKTGVAHGCKAEDIFGCLYFYLTDTLNTFVQRMNQLQITFYLFTKDCDNLAKEQSSGKMASFGLPASTKYDRIDMSNTVDDKYVGFRKVISKWGPLLNEKNSSSTLVSYSMNWPFSKPSASPDADPEAMGVILRKAVGSGWLRPAKGHVGSYQGWNSVTISLMNGAPALYDNSSEFEEFLRGRHIGKLAQSLKLRVKPVNTIVPHRIGGKLEASWKDVRDFESEEQWYNEVCLGYHSFYERYVEISPVRE